MTFRLYVLASPKHARVSRKKLLSYIQSFRVPSARKMKNNNEYLQVYMYMRIDIYMSLGFHPQEKKKKKKNLHICMYMHCPPDRC